MPDRNKAGKRAGRRFSILDIAIRILIFAALALGTAFALRPIQINLQNRIARIRDDFIGRAEEKLGRRIQYGSIGPSIFGVLDIRDVLVVRDDGSVVLSVARLRLSYSIVELIRRNVINAFHSVRIDRPVLSLDFAKDADLAERFALPAGRRASSGRAEGGDAPAGGDAGPIRRSGGGFRELLPENFSFRIWNGEWELSGSGAGLKLSGFGLDASVRQDRINFQGRWNASGAVGGRGVPVPGGSDSALFSAAMAGRISGEYFVGAQEGSAAVVIPSLAGENFRLKPVTISFFLSGGRLEARKTHDKSPAAFSLVYEHESRKLSGRFEGENFPLHDLLAFSGSWKGYDSLLAARVTGSAGFEREASGALSYRADFSGSSPGNSLVGPVSLAIKAAGDKERATFDALDIRSPYGDLSFAGEFGFSPAAPSGLLSVSNLSLNQNAASRSGGDSGQTGISGDFSIHTRGREIGVFGENIRAGDAALSALDATLYREEGGLAFAVSALRFRNIESYENVRMSSLSFEGSMNYAVSGNGAAPAVPEDSRHIEATLKLDSFSIGDILSFAEPLASIPALPAPARSAAEDLSVTTEVFFTTDYENILYNAPRIVAAYEGFGGFLAAASLSGTNRRFELSEGRVSWENGNAAISGSVDFSDPADVSFAVGASYKDLAYYLEGMILDRQSVSVRGSYGFQAYLGSGGTGAYSGYVQGDNIPFPSGDGLASLSFLFSLFYDSPADWQARVDKFEIAGLSTPASAFASLRFSGEANQRGMLVPDLFFDDGRGALNGNVSLEWDHPFSFCRFDAELSGGSRGERYGLNGIYRERELELLFSGQGMQLSRFSPYNAAVDGELRLFWESFSSFEADARLASLVWRRQDGDVRVSAEASMNADSFLLRELQINYSDLEASVPYLSVNRETSLAEAKALVRGELSGRPVSVSCQGVASFNATETWLDVLGGINSLEGSLRVDAARFDAVEAREPFTFAFSCLRERAGLAMNLSGGPRNMIRFRYSPGAAAAENAAPLAGLPPRRASGGNFYAALSAPSPVRGSVAGSIDSQSIDAQGTDLYVDLGSLWRFMPADSVVAVPAGIVTASIRVVGSLEDPEFYGSARGTSVQLRVPEYLPEPIRPAPVTISLSGTEMTFGPAAAAVGRGAGVASGWFRFDQWIPNIFSIDIQVPQETPVPYDFDISGLLAHGLVSGKMNLSMEDLILSLTGDLVADNTEISLSGEFGIQDDDSGPKIVTAVSDITVKAARRVEFFWPSVEFPVIQANPDMGSGIRVTSDSASRRFTLTGDVNLRSGELFYLTRNFYLREGTLYFNENETQFDPRISARAEIRDQAESGPVTISLIIDNAPLMSFTPRFVSNPPLSQIEIYSLLGQNPLGEAGEGAQPQTNIAAAAVTDLLTQFTVMRRLQREVRNFLGLDMLSARTQLLQNVVFQAAGAQPSAYDEERPYRVGNYFDNTTVYIGKYFSAEIFAQAMLSLKYDENKQDYGGIDLEPEISLEMRNPLFDVQFNMLPQHLENWFIDDISFSLIWRRSF